jgi:hypothetical protein
MPSLLVGRPTNCAADSGGEDRRDSLSEDLALAMGLLFKLLTPMRNVVAIENCARDTEAMAREEAAYWLGRRCTARTPGECWQRCGCC